MRVKAAGAEFAFLKASEGTTFVDRQYKRNYVRAKAAGLIVGAYHFFQPRTSVEAQVDNFLRAVGKLELGDLLPVLDVENGALWSGISRKGAVDLILAWCKGVEKKLGNIAQPILYMSPSFAADVLGNDSLLKDYPLWLAH